MTMNLQHKCIATVFLIISSATSICHAARPSKSEAAATAKDPVANREELLAALIGQDQSRIADAVNSVTNWTIIHPTARPLANSLNLFIEAKRYGDVMKISDEVILKSPGYTEAVSVAQRFRAQALLGAGKVDDALVAAKAYFNVATLKDTSDAIDSLAACLAAKHADNLEIVRRFKEQQVRWASRDPDNTTDRDLGTPVLTAIKTSDDQYKDIIAQLKPMNYPEHVAKGNLLLLGGRFQEARAVFEKALLIAPLAKEVEAKENVARALRAESGYIWTANKYIQSLHEKAAN